MYISDFVNPLQSGIYLKIPFHVFSRCCVVRLFGKVGDFPHVFSPDIKHQINPPVRSDFYENIS